VKPDIGIGIDVTLSCDTPGVPEQDRTTLQGKGFGLHIRDGSFIADKALVADFAALAEKKKIPYQRTMLRSGGQDGAAGRIRIGEDGRDLPGKGTVRVRAGETLVFETPGGGGFGPPGARAPDALAADVEAGFVTPAAAREIYGGKS
jgi:hypothetical protein